MHWYIVVFVFITLLGAFTLSYQIYKLTELDASCRGLKHPKFWGFFALSGNNGNGGLLLYLLGRRKYPAQISQEDAVKMNSRKKKAGVSLLFLAVGAICLMVSAVLTM
ncbi:MAG: hypothetical protein Q4D16_19440 [Eubacteriales bacterium]|nr:hypothetical protein [Eubacteriales bacterium]